MSAIHRLLCRLGFRKSCPLPHPPPIETHPEHDPTVSTARAIRADAESLIQQRHPGDLAHVIREAWIGSSPTGNPLAIPPDRDRKERTR